MLTYLIYQSFLLSGTLGAKELATQSVMFQIEGVSYMVCPIYSNLYVLVSVIF